MAFISKRKINGKIYYYLVESQRINGKSCKVRQECLGTADKIAQKMAAANGGIPDPLSSTVLDFGAVSALLDLATRVGIRQIIERQTGKQDQGLPVSDSILLAAINRAVAPTSKKSLYQWFERTVLPGSFHQADRENLSSQEFWNNLTSLNQEKITAIEDELTHWLVEKYPLANECLLFDNRNFCTYVNTINPGTLPKKGNHKEKRRDLKTVGLSLLVSSSDNIPLFHETYAADAKRFSEIVDALKSRYGKLGRGVADITLVFDRDNNSPENIQRLLEDKSRSFHFVGSLRSNQCPELGVVPQTAFAPLAGEEFAATKAYRTTMEVYGLKTTVVITDNPDLLATQMRGVKSVVAKCQTALKQLQDTLAKWAAGGLNQGKKPTFASVEKKLAAILSHEHMQDIFDCHIDASDPDHLSLDYSLNREKLRRVQEEILGKTVLFTDQDTWSNEKIVGTYRSRYQVEESFRQLKDTKYLSFHPVRQFTEQTIRIHAFYCVLALTLCSVLKMELAQMGHPMRIHRVLEMLSDVQEVISVFPGNASGTTVVKPSFSRLEGVAKEYIEKFGLTKYAEKA
ncbi:MAG: IS1634 family transposase [Planctomycetota bacterium]|jgi:transposase|nr:IS1634 family transposase [Planctomycetota bacterium]